MLPRMLALGLLLCAGSAPAPAPAADEVPAPSRWGADDTLGAINEITPEVILAAAKLVTEGKRYALGQVTGRNTPAFGDRSFELYAVSHGLDGTGEPLGANKMTFNDDWMLTWMGVGSQIDGLGHVGIDHVYYNGNHVRDFFSHGGLRRFGIHELPPIVTRGVVLDILGYLREQGSDAVTRIEGAEMLAAATPINRAEIEGAAARQGVELRAGDVVLLHTGFMRMAEIDPVAYKKSIPGLGVAGALYLAEKRPVAVGSDTFALEVLPPERAGQAFPVHLELIPKRGIYVLENMVTAELVADRAWEFLFVLGAPRFEGAVQMVINPVGIR